jgi:hypothetical protein
VARSSKLKPNISSGPPHIARIFVARATRHHQERTWAQVLIRPAGKRYHLCHADDRAEAELKLIPVAELRELAMTNARGEFRPLKSAPDLRRGWRCECDTPGELWRAMQELYPGSVPDWFAAQGEAPPVTNYREFTNRQTGMYRITQLHSDEQAARVIAACCPPHLCLKQRLWTVEGGKDIQPDKAEAKSSIPCLEPCALLLELARKSARIEQEEKIAGELAPSEWETLAAAAEYLARERPASTRAGDTGAPLNPRRLELVWQKIPKPKTKD